MPFTPKAPPEARFYENDGLEAELMAARIELRYDPTTQSAGAIFDGMLYAVNSAGEYTPFAGTHDTLAVSFADQMARCYAGELGVPVGDPVTGADLSQVSVAGFMTLVKIAYNLEINAREAARIAALQPGAGA